MTTQESRVNEFGQPIGAAVEFIPPPVPSGEPLHGTLVTLVPLRVEHAASLSASLNDAAGEEQWTYMPFPASRTEAEVAAVVTSLLDTVGWVPYAVLNPEGKVIGTATLMRIDPAAGSMEVGCILFGEGLRRVPAGTEAMYLLALHAFELGYRRYEWKCDSLNEPSRRAALRLGFSFEGIFRNALVYKGRNRDTAWFAMTDQDWPVIREAFEKWLAPANFLPDGSQRRSLTELRAALD